MAKNLAKLFDSDPDFFLAERLANVNSDYVRSKVFENLEFSLIDERTRIVNEVGTVI
jgi:hypothetical protein